MSSAIHTNCAGTTDSGWQEKLVRRDVAVLGASTNDNYSVGREGGSHRAIEHNAEKLRDGGTRRHVRIKPISVRRIANN